jgi:hypothetical protein
MMKTQEKTHKLAMSITGAGREAILARQTASASQNRAEHNDWLDHNPQPTFAIPGRETKTEKSVNWSKAFCPVCQPIVNRHFIPREAHLLAHAERLAEALRLVVAHFDTKGASIVPFEELKSKLRAALAEYERERSDRTEGRSKNQ